MSTTAAFYFDLCSPLAYLAAERVLHVLPQPAEWRPVLASELGAMGTPGAGAGAGAGDVDEAELRAALERRAAALGLQPLRWPEPFPFDSGLAMSAATYAASIGRTVPFAQAAFRQAFAGGHSLEDLDFVLIAAAACEMHPSAVVAGVELASVRTRLHETTAQAGAQGVSGVPALVVDTDVFVGEHALERASARMRTPVGSGSS